MSVLNDMLQKEKNTNAFMQSYYADLISKTPTGSIIIKRVGNKEYCYLHYKENGKTKNDYCGEASRCSSIAEEVLRRKHYAEMLRRLKKERSKLERMERIR